MFAAVATDIVLDDAFVGEMIPAVAFQTSDWFLLALGYLQSFLTDNYTVQYCRVRLLGLGEVEDDMAADLIRRSS